MSIIRTNDIDLRSMSLEGLRGLTEVVHSNLFRAMENIKESKKVTDDLEWRISNDPDYTIEDAESDLTNGLIILPQTTVPIHLKHKGRPTWTVGGNLDVCRLITEHSVDIHTPLEELEKIILKWITATLCSKDSIGAMYIDGYDYSPLDYIKIE